jgi:hypothetical protein
MQAGTLGKKASPVFVFIAGGLTETIVPDRRKEAIFRRQSQMTVHGQFFFKNVRIASDVEKQHRKISEDPSSPLHQPCQVG